MCALVVRTDGAVSRPGRAHGAFCECSGGGRPAGRVDGWMCGCVVGLVNRRAMVGKLIVCDVSVIGRIFTE